MATPLAISYLDWARLYKNMMMTAVIRIKANPPNTIAIICVFLIAP